MAKLALIYTKNPQDVAKMWEDGLKASFQDKARVQKFANVEKTIYTPGSSAGVSVNILGSFEAPSQEVLDDNDTFSSLINATVSSILALLSIEADPINSKEHILLSNIFYHFYTQKISLTLEDIIGHIASPPFEKIGIMSLKTFYNQADRMKLAMALNGIISSVSFSSWIEGEALDIQNMLYDDEGKAKIAIFSIAHLSDNERMFFVTILLNSYINWMRKQSGSSSLKALLYMDEIFGYFPPSKNPPSKEPMLLLLKQARAFGTGVILSTQNPVDIDYKGLSNIGTWFVGKLQTKQDIDKVLEPLSLKSDLSKKEIEQKIATLKARHFFMKNVHASETIEFSSRWALSYLKGPMTKDDIKLLMKQKKENHIKPIMTKEVHNQKTIEHKQILSSEIKEYFVDTNINANTAFYPSLYASVKLRFFNQKRSIDMIENIKFKLDLDEKLHTLNWHEAYEEDSTITYTHQKPNAQFTPLPQIIVEAKNLKAVEKSLSNYLYTSKNLELFGCQSLKLESKLNQTQRNFIVDVENRLKELRDEQLQKLEDKFATKIKRLESKITRLEIKLQKEQEDVSEKTTDTIVDIGLAVIGAFFGSKTISSSTMRKGASAFKKGKKVFKEKNDVTNVETLLQETYEDIEELEESLKNEIEKIEDTLTLENYEITPFYINPRRSDIIIQDIAILWER